MIEEKIARYKSAIAQGEKILKEDCSNREYYEKLIVRFKKMLRFYEELMKDQIRTQETSFPLINNKR